MEDFPSHIMSPTTTVVFSPSAEMSISHLYREPISLASNRKQYRNKQIIMFTLTRTRPSTSTRRLFSFTLSLRSMATTIPNNNNNVGPLERLIRTKVNLDKIHPPKLTNHTLSLSSTVDKRLYAHLASDT